MTMPSRHLTPTQAYRHILVVGAGSFGTALAHVLEDSDAQTIALWTRQASHAAEMEKQRENVRYLPGCLLGDKILPVTGTLDPHLLHADLVLSAIPTQSVRSVFEGYGS